MSQRIVLNKRDKTIKIVNRRNTIRLQHTGKGGPQGEQGDTPLAIQPDAPNTEWLWVDTDDYTEGINQLFAGYLYTQLAADPDSIISGTITRDANGAVTTAQVVWPDGTGGTYTSTELSEDFPGSVDAYTITYNSNQVITYTQPAVTRDSTGAVIVRPAIGVA